MHSRYIVWQECDQDSRTSVPDLLESYPEVSILRSHGPDQAVVLMDTDTERKIRDEHPRLSVEPDSRHRLVSSK